MAPKDTEEKTIEREVEPTRERTGSTEGTQHADAKQGEDQRNDRNLSEQEVRKWQDQHIEKEKQKQKYIAVEKATSIVTVTLSGLTLFFIVTALIFLMFNSSGIGGFMQGNVIGLLSLLGVVSVALQNLLIGQIEFVGR